MRFDASITKEWLSEFKDYEDYRRQTLQAKQAMPDRTLRLLSEEEYDKLRWGIGDEMDRNDQEHKELGTRVNALESRMDGALGHLYGAEGRGGVLDAMEKTQVKMIGMLEQLDAKFDALILKSEQDKAHVETQIAKVQVDVNNIGKKVRESGAGWRKFKDAGLVAAAGALTTGILVMFWRGLQTVLDLVG